MLEVFAFWSRMIGKCVGWLFNDFVIIESPKITFGSFVLACLIIGLVIYFLLCSDLIPFSGWSLSNEEKDNYAPRHGFLSGRDNYKPTHNSSNGGLKFSTRESRHKK